MLIAPSYHVDERDLQIEASIYQRYFLINRPPQDHLFKVNGFSLAGHREVVKLLLAKGAEINAKDKNGKTALILAARTNHPDVRQLLIEAGAK
jgi:ankyrin repeat protein